MRGLTEAMTWRALSSESHRSDRQPTVRLCTACYGRLFGLLPGIRRTWLEDPLSGMHRTSQSPLSAHCCHTVINGKIRSCCSALGHTISITNYGYPLFAV